MYARARSGTLAISELISLMSTLGVDAGAVRSSVSRMKRRGVLVSTRKDGAAAYRLSDSLEEVFRAGDRRIFGQERAALDDPWLLASFSVPERERPVRHQLRTLLMRLGFGQVSGGLWIAPGIIVEESRSSLARAELTGYVDLFLGNCISDEPLELAVRKWWDLAALETHYRAFVETNSAAADRPGSDRDAFSAYTTAITQWRRLPYLDPGIPIELLPAGWAGIEAETLFATLRERLGEPAERFVDSQLISV
jgi:phenylacetic acid degradation operon negative regulatory protein